MTLTNGNNYAYQWDRGLSVATEDPVGTIARFANKHGSKSIPVTAIDNPDDDNVIYRIPDILLATGRDVVMYYLDGEGETTEHIVGMDTLPVFEAQKPDDYVWTDTEVKIWKSKINEPYIDGEDGYVLHTDGNGGRYWHEIEYAYDNLTDVFIAEYGVTTFAEVNTAFLAGYHLFCKYNGELVQHIGEDETGHVFSTIEVDLDTGNGRAASLIVTSTGWRKATVPIEGSGTYDYEELDNKPTINGATLEGDLSSADLGLAPEEHTHSVTDITGLSVPIKVSELENDEGFLTEESDPTVPEWAKAVTKPSYTAAEVGAVPTERTVNGKALSSNIELSPEDVGAAPASHTHTESDITNLGDYVPTERTVNGKALSSNISLTYSDVDAAPTSHSHAQYALEADVSVLESRMDEFASLTEGSTTGDAELADIRVGADGKSYVSAGNAVRGQVSTLKSVVENVTGNEEIVFTSGAYIKTDSSTVSVNSPVSNTGYRYAVVPCVEGEWFTVNVDGAGGARAWAFVKADGTKIVSSSSNVNPRSALRAPKDSRYLVLNCKASATYIPSYKGILNKYKSESINQKVDALTNNGEWKTIHLPFQICNLQLYDGGTVSMNMASTTRASTVPGLFLFAPKDTKLYINDENSTAQLFVIKQDLSGNISASSWAKEYTVTQDEYLIPCLRYSDDSTVSDANLLGSKLTIELAPYAQITSQRNWENRWFFDVSHRGYMYEAPESTIAALCRAKAVGYNTVECDLRITSDGEIVVHHNAGMPSDSSYRIADHTLAELRANANMGTYHGITQNILTFDDLIKTAKDLDLAVFVELKATFSTSQISAIIATAKKYDMKERVYWMASYNSSNFDYVGNFRSVDADCNILVYDTTNANNISPFVVAGKRITFCYARVTYITSTVVQNMANIGVDTIGWCVTFSWLLPDYTETQVIQKIYDTLDCGVRGMCVDQWTIASLIRRRYSDYF